MMLSVEIITSVFFGALLLLVEQHLNQITKTTRITMKIAFWLLASGLTVLAFGPWLHMPVWFLLIGSMLALLGGVFLANFNRYECNLFGCKVLDAVIRKIREKWEKEK